MVRNKNIYHGAGCEAGGLSCLERPLPACVLDDPFVMQRQKRDARYREYAEALGQGMTVQQVAQGFDVSERVVRRALAWARKEETYE